MIHSIALLFNTNFIICVGFYFFFLSRGQEPGNIYLRPQSLGTNVFPLPTPLAERYQDTNRWQILFCPVETRLRHMVKNSWLLDPSGGHPYLQTRTFVNLIPDWQPDCKWVTEPKDWIELVWDRRNSFQVREMLQSLTEPDCILPRSKWPGTLRYGKNDIKTIWGEKR